MFVKLFFEEEIAFFKVFQDEFIGVFTEKAGKIAGVLRETAMFVNHLQKRQGILPSDFGVIFAEGGRNMDDTGAVRKRYVSVACDIESFILSGIEIKQRLIADKFVFFSFLYIYFFIGTFFENGRYKCVGENIVFFSRFYTGVILVGVHTQRDV